MKRDPHAKEAYIVPRPLRPEQLVIRVREDPSRAVSILANYDAAALRELICTVVQMGWAITVSVTSDGGAVSISCYDGTKKRTCYGRSSSHFERSIRDLLELLGDEE